MKDIKLPFYAKASLIFIGLFAFIGMLYIAQGIIIPLIYSTIIAIVDFIEKDGVYTFQKNKE